MTDLDLSSLTPSAYFSSLSSSLRSSSSKVPYNNVELSFLSYATWFAAVPVLRSRVSQAGDAGAEDLVCKALGMHTFSAVDATTGFPIQARRYPSEVPFSFLSSFVHAESDDVTTAALLSLLNACLAFAEDFGKTVFSPKELERLPVSLLDQVLSLLPPDVSLPFLLSLFAAPPKAAGASPSLSPMSRLAHSFSGLPFLKMCNRLLTTVLSRDLCPPNPSPSHVRLRGDVMIALANAYNMSDKSATTGGNVPRPPPMPQRNRPNRPMVDDKCAVDEMTQQAARAAETLLRNFLPNPLAFVSTASADDWAAVTEAFDKCLTCLDSVAVSSSAESSQAASRPHKYRFEAELLPLQLEDRAFVTTLSVQLLLAMHAIKEADDFARAAQVSAEATASRSSSPPPPIVAAGVVAARSASPPRKGDAVVAAAPIPRGTALYNAVTPRLRAALDAACGGCQANAPDPLLVRLMDDLLGRGPLSRECWYIDWKRGGCKPFELNAEELNGVSVGGTATVDAGGAAVPQRGGSDKEKDQQVPLSALSSRIASAAAPTSITDFLEPFAEFLDPANDIDEEYSVAVDPVYCWRAMRRITKAGGLKAFGRGGHDGGLDVRHKDEGGKKIAWAEWGSADDKKELAASARLKRKRKVARLQGSGKKNGAREELETLVRGIWKEKGTELPPPRRPRYDEVEEEEEAGEIEEGETIEVEEEGVNSAIASPMEEEGVLFAPEREAGEGGDAANGTVQPMITNEEGAGEEDGMTSGSGSWERRGEGDDSYAREMDDQSMIEMEGGDTLHVDMAYGPDVDVSFEQRAEADGSYVEGGEGEGEGLEGEDVIRQVPWDQAQGFVTCGQITRLLSTGRTPSSRMSRGSVTTRLGQKLLIKGDLGTCIAGPCWIWDPLRFKEDDEKNTVDVQSVWFATENKVAKFSCGAGKLLPCSAFCNNNEDKFV